MLSTKDQARPHDNYSFQHFLGLLPWGVQLQGVSLFQRTLQEIFHWDSRQQHCSLNSQPCVKLLHGLQGFQKGFDIEVVVILRLIGIPFHLQLPEHSLTVLVLFEGQYKLVFQFWNVASLERPACRQSQATHAAAMILKAWPRTFSPMLHNLCPSLHSFRCPGTWTSGWT